MTLERIPYYVDPPPLSRALVDEITGIVFGTPVEPQPCDVIFIFGGSHPGLWETGAAAYFAGLGRDVIVTGGYKPGAPRHWTWRDGTVPEATVIRRELVRLGVPESRITIETQSTNTYENVRFALEAYDFGAVSSVLAVCKSYAVGRQIRTLRAQLDARTRVIPYPFDTHIGGDGPFVTRETWMDFPESRAFVFATLLKIDRYGRMGHLVPIEGMSEELAAVVRGAIGESRV
jgi:hypothetical protein